MKHGSGMKRQLKPLRRKEDAIRYGMKAEQQVIRISIKNHDEMQGEMLLQRTKRQQIVSELESTAGKKYPQGLQSKWQNPGRV